MRRFARERGFDRDERSPQPPLAALPLLREKFESSVRRRYPPAQADRIREICSDTEALRAMRADEFMDLFTSTEI